MTPRAQHAPSELSDLHVAIRLKADLLHRLGTHDRSRWTNDVLRFVTALERSRLTDRTALVVLLTELREELGLLLGLEWMRRKRDESTPPIASTLQPDLPRHEILWRFKEEVLSLLAAAAAHPRLSSIVKRAQQMIDERYADPLTLERLATAVGCSKRRLATVFRQELAMTVHEYLTRTRLRRALELIRDGEKIEAVSLLVGYRSKKNFYRHFNAYVGVTPVAYRAALLSIGRR